MKDELAFGAGLGLVALLAVGLLLWRGSVALRPGGALEVLNPASDKNFAYSAVNAVGGAVTGDKDFSLGARVWELLNPGAVARERAMLEPPRDTSYDLLYERLPQGFSA